MFTSETKYLFSDNSQDLFRLSNAVAFCQGWKTDLDLAK